MSQHECSTGLSYGVIVLFFLALLKKSASTCGPEICPLGMRCGVSNRWEFKGNCSALLLAEKLSNLVTGAGGIAQGQTRLGWAGRLY